jgi:nucleoside-diphosphate-sugar epimerase
MAKTALVTGSAGFVGRNFAHYLREHGYDVRECDINGATRYDARNLFRVDFRHNYDLVVHCAAIVGGRKVIDGAPLALASNLELDAGLFQWALRAKPKRIIYFSSSAVYPVCLQQKQFGTPLEESLITPALTQNYIGTPDSLYGWAKLTGENLAHRYREAALPFDGKVSVVRPFSGYGKDQSADYPFAAFIDRALRREDPFTIWGDGQQTRDFINVNDIISIVMAMVIKEIDGPVNLGTGRPMSMLDLAALVTDVAGYNPAFKMLPAEPSGVQYRVADITELRKFYTSSFMTLETGINVALQHRSRM